MLDLIKKNNLQEYPVKEQYQLIKANGSTCKCCGGVFKSKNGDVKLSAFEVFTVFPELHNVLTIHENSYVSCKECNISMSEFIDFFRIFKNVNFGFMLNVYLAFFAKNAGSKLLAEHIGEENSKIMTLDSLSYEFWDYFFYTLNASAEERAVFYLYYKHIKITQGFNKLFIREDFEYVKNTVNSAYTLLLRTTSCEKKRYIKRYCKYREF